MQRRRPHEQGTFLRRRRREASRALALLVCLVLAQKAQALPIVDRFVQNVFEPDRLNRWFTLWEKVIHLARFHVHNIPRIIMMPFSNIHTMHGRAKDIRRGLSDLPLRSILGRVQAFTGFAGDGGGTVTGRNDYATESPASVKKAAQSLTPQPSVVRAKQ
ncbi:uncharacterized protein LOC119386916 [Rhipicephalus sanguineus]|uniref:Secreted protein n=1 Tax=Rhipicephalus sanguineus TaxID=34632 RepID=A0A9D4Q0X1_RHISA|nr:uncharacterized protein LOC119386916 [Rhipicephalus sanguineus]KAH7961912.1 hypothetical protein HPB52_013375 [Rhipicephalus sanguineus]